MSCKRQKFPIDQDPDYENITIHQNKRVKLLEKEATEANIKKIHHIIKTQFAEAIAAKELEIDDTDQRLHQARSMLDQLRAFIVASYYSTNEKLSYDSAGRSLQAPVHPAVKRDLRGKKPRDKYGWESSATTSSETATSDSNSTGTICFTNNVNTQSIAVEEPAQMLPIPVSINSDNSRLTNTDSSSVDIGRASRFKVTRKIIVGNISKYIPLDKREGNDQFVYKWMVYIRTPKDEASIDTFVKKVVIFLHKSYRPNDLVEISKPPFQLTRRGWGEFLMRIHIHFHDPRNKPIEIVHMLKLGKNPSGLEMIESETVTNVQIYKTEKTLPTTNKEVPERPVACTVSNSTIPADTAETNQKIEFLNRPENSSALTPRNNIKVEVPIKEEKSEINDESQRVSKIKEAINVRTLLKSPFTPNDVSILSKAQTNFISNPTSLLNSPKPLNKQVTVLNPGKQTKNFTTIQTEKPQIIVSPSTNNQCLKLKQDLPTTKQWTTGVSLLQKVKPNPAQSNYPATTNSNTLLILPKTGHKQETNGISGASNNARKSLNSIVKTSETPTPVLLISTSNSTATTTKANLEKNQALNEIAASSLLRCSANNANQIVKPQLKSHPSPIKTQNDLTNNCVTYVKCVNQQGDLILVPETFLKLPAQQPVVLPNKGLVGDCNNGTKQNQQCGSDNARNLQVPSLPMYHLQVMPANTYGAQAHLVQLPSSKLSTATSAKNSLISKSLLIAQNTPTSSISNSVVQINVPAQNTHPYTLNVEAHTHKMNVENLDSMTDIVKYFVKLHPLIAENFDRTVHPYCSSSVERFLSWYTGKQRAAEWQRAKAVQKAIEEAFNESKKWKGKKIWSTKNILWWCRRWGFTPVRSDENNSEENKNKEIAPTYSEAKELCTQLERVENSQKSIDESTEEEVDVVSIHDTIKPLQKTVTEIENQDVLHLASDPQAEMVRDVAAQIGVKLKPVEVYPGVIANVVEEMILAACRCLTENLVRNSLAHGFERLGGKKCPNVVNLGDVYHCIQSMPEFDFLTNKFLGKNVNIETQTPLPLGKNEMRQS